MYLKRASESLGELLLDNGGTVTTNWSTPLLTAGLLRLNGWQISGNARVSATNWVRVRQGDPAYFTSLISSNYLQVGGLIVSNTWVYGNIMELEIRRATDAVRVTLWGETNKPHSLQGSTSLTNWLPLVTNLPVNSRFEFLDTNAPALDRRFYRGVKP